MNCLTSPTSYLLLFFLLLSSTLIGQSSECGFDQTFQTATTDSIFQKNNLAYEKAYQEYMHSDQKRSYQADEFLDLPVVFHIIHKGDSLGSVANPRDESVFQVLEYANQLFRHTDTEQTYQNPFYGIDTDIGFCLASETPDGRSTNGIIRYAENPNYFVNISSASWDRERYINVFIRKDESYCAYFSPTAGRIIVADRCLLSKNILAHELGHYLSLRHTFVAEGECVNQDCLTQGDYICDTPPQESGDAVIAAGLTGPCLHPGNSCESDEDDISIQNPYRSVSLGGLGDQPDANNNVMSYTGTCVSTFTAGQTARMKFNLTEERKNLRALASGCGKDIVFENDIAMDRVYAIPIDDCGYEVTIYGELKNYGTSDLNSLKVTLYRDNIALDSLGWIGHLKPGESRPVSFNHVSTFFGVNRFEVKVENANPTLGDNPSNNRGFTKFSYNNIEKANIEPTRVIVNYQDTIPIGIDLFGAEDDFHFRWWRENGPIEQDQQGKPIIRIFQADRYFVEIYNKDYTCTWMEEILVYGSNASVTDDFQPVILGVDGPITCRTPSIRLLDYYTTNSDVEWYSRDGFIEKDISSLRVDSAGDYRIKVTNIYTGLVNYSAWFTVLDLRDSISMDLSASGEISCDSKEVRIEAFSSDEDFSDYTFIWKDLRDGERIISEGTDPFITVSEPGRYGVEARKKDHLFSCKIQREIDVNGSVDVPRIIIKMPEQSDFTNTDTTRLDATLSEMSENFTYQWITDYGEIIDGENTLNPLVKGYAKYTLELKSESDKCNQRSTIDLVPSHLINLQVLCSSPSSNLPKAAILLSIEGCHGFSIVDPVWTTPLGVEEQDDFIIVQEAGSYSVKYFNGLDWIYDTMFIAQKYFHVPDARIESVGRIECIDEESVLSGLTSTYTGGDFFIWRDRSEALLGEGVEISVKGEGRFRLNAISQHTYCWSSDLEWIDYRPREIIAKAGPDIILNCAESAAFLGENEVGENLEFRWFYLEESDSIFIGNSPTLQVGIPRKYFLELHDKNINCYSYDDVDVVIAEEAEVSISTKVVSDSCLDYNTILFVDNLDDFFDYTIEWTLPNGEINTNFFQPAKQAGTYRVDYFSNSSSCAKSDFFDYIPILDLDMDVTLQDVSCQGARDGLISATPVGGVPPYIWNNNNEGEQIHLSPGSYILSLTDSIGCTVHREVIIDEPSKLELDQFVMNANELLVEIVGSTPPYTYIWNTGSTQKQIQDPKFKERYTVMVTDANGCTVTQEIQYLKSPNNESVIILPNPASDRIQIFIQSGDPVEEIKFFNTLGVCVQTIQDYQSLDWIDISRWSSGVYLTVLSGESVNQTIKFVKE